MMWLGHLAVFTAFVSLTTAGGFFESCLNINVNDSIITAKCKETTRRKYRDAKLYLEECLGVENGKIVVCILYFHGTWLRNKGTYFSANISGSGWTLRQLDCP